MASYSKKEFAVLCGMETKKLSVYVSRNQVVVVNDQIDSDNEKNRAFLQKHAQGIENASSIASGSVQAGKKGPLPDLTQENTEIDGVPQLFVSERLLKHRDTIKRQKEIEKLDLDIQKRRGEVIPYELIKPIFLQHNQSIITAFKNGIEEIIRNFSKKKSLTGAEMAEIRGLTVQIINEAMGKATTASIKGVDSLISEFSIKKGVGERS